MLPLPRHVLREEEGDKMPTERVGRSQREAEGKSHEEINVQEKKPQ